MRKKDIYLFAALILVSLLSFFLLLPDAQEATNSHMRDASVLGTVFYGFSGLLVVTGLNALVERRGYKSFSLFLFFAATLAYWGYRFHSLECLGCLNSG